MSLKKLIYERAKLYANVERQMQLRGLCVFLKTTTTATTTTTSLKAGGPCGDHRTFCSTQHGIQHNFRKVQRHVEWGEYYTLVTSGSSSSLAFGACCAAVLVGCGIGVSTAFGFGAEGEVGLGFAFCAEDFTSVLALPVASGLGLGVLTKEGD
jgi:hypothetical protein